MNLIFFTEARFFKNNGQYYASESSFSMHLFSRYLVYFDTITICARVKEVKYADLNADNLISHPSISFVPLPYYKGFYQFLLKWLRLKFTISRFIKSNVAIECVYLARVPGRIGSIAIDSLILNNIPYGIEVVGDPYDVLSNGATNLKIASLIRYFSVRSLKFITKNSSVTLYVTDKMLQNRYPTLNFSIGVSDVIMPPEAYLKKIKEFDITSSFRLVCVGSLDQMYKAPDIMLKSIKWLKEHNIPVHLTWIGDGVFKEDMIELANKLDIASDVSFIGRLTNPTDVRVNLDKAHLFVMPSRMEGLPRAMVEAMARGLPCIGTKISGIQELLDENCLVNVNDVEGLAAMIRKFYLSKDLLLENSSKNLLRSMDFKDEILKPKRELFFEKLKELGKSKY